MNAKRVIESIIASLIVTALSFLFCTTFNYYLSSDGVLKIESPIVLGNNTYVPINIENQSDKMVNDILLNVPHNVTVETIISNTPLLIKQVETNVSGGIKQFNLSHIQARTKTFIYIPIEAAVEQSQIRFANANERNFVIYAGNHVKSPLKEAIKDALIYAITLFIIYFIFSLWHIKRTDCIREELKKIEIHERELNEDIEKQKREGGLINKELKKVELTYFARLSDYSKELNFWRDTIRKILYEEFKDKKEANKIIDAITDTLKTYSTKYSLHHNFEFIKLYADIIKDK